MQRLTLYAGPLAAAAIGLFSVSQGLSPAAAWTAGIAALCAIWWVAQPIPIPVTSLLPVALFPLLGIVSAKEVGEAYGNPMVLLFLGGFILSTSLEHSGGHRRLAIGMIRLCALGPRAIAARPVSGEGAPVVSGRQLVLGFMLAAGGVSMWVSNSATALMLLPIGVAALQGVTDRRLRTALLLSIAYGANIGGVATPIGSPPNLICLQEYAAVSGAEPTFMTWMTFGLPVAVVMLPIAAFWLSRGLGGPAETDLPHPGPWRTAEWRTLVVFGVTALLWIMRKDPFGGWSGALGLPGANDASVGLLAVVALFLIPSGEPSGPGEPAPKLLDWQTAVKIPWGMLLLFSGGLVLARAFGNSGLSDALGESLNALATMPTPLLVGSLCLAVTFLTEVTSNTATTAMLMPLLAAMSQSTGIEASLLMFPAAISASFAFMLPVATPPNAAVYGAGVEARDMAREGLALNLIGVVVVTALATLLLGV
ncbi:Sodium-dependent dicarboxylate transporter SdcS [Botrimarina colliarenosi]|uniref:Sodium-dependent dicarboxylate transporter SdcS n=1 Tax=Botrimarina colliarenosi TaxID=2528001 RepID=A0A5C6A7J4_9BACT|nr:SLC13 family permease [Botrimarina colliarenosi]TWT95268.1 Sodium-dependent dicarboxylate transporter SdcS [Botrimarina colliarenosi]